MKKTPNYIKKTLDEVKDQLMKDKNLELSRKLYIEKLKEIFSEKVINLKDGLETKMSSTGTDKSVAVTTDEIPSKENKKQSYKNSQKIIFLNNEVLDHNLSEIDEANNDLINLSENIIELKEEITENNNQRIIELIEEVDDIINLTDEVAEEVLISNRENEIQTSPNDEINNQKDIQKKSSFSGEQLELLNNKINDLDLNSSELTEKLDELLDQKNLFSEKFNEELDIKLNEALNRSEESLESKLNNINDTYHQEFSKYEDEANKNFANLEDQIGHLNSQFENIQNNINLISSKIEENLNQFSEPQIEKKFEDKINDLKNYNLKIENSLNNLNNKIDETLEKISLHKNENFEKFNEINQKIQSVEPDIINKIEENQKNKTESEKLQDKFDQMSKIMDLQNMRMLQMYHSSELQHSHSILQKNMEKNSLNNKTNNDPQTIAEDFKNQVFPKIQKEMDKQFNLLKEQLSEYEIKSVLDKIKTTDLNKEFKKPIKKFNNLFDAKKYVKNSITKKSRDWIKSNDLTIDEIAKKLLEK